MRVAAGAQRRLAQRRSASRPVLRARWVQHDAPDEVVAVSKEEEYTEYRKLTDLREPYQ